MRTKRTAFLLLAFGGAIACGGGSPPRELVAARTTYDAVQRGPAARLNPADLQTAKESLDRAEQAYQENKDSPETRDLAYIAERRAMLADVRALERQANIDKNRALAQLQTVRAQQLQLTSAELQRTREQLQAEAQRRAEAEKQAAQAAEELSRIASVKKEERGMVITLPGSVLFASGKANLLGPAQSKLSEVANVLGKQGKDAKIVVEGHTDSSGSPTMNEDLSKKRADAVRDFLVAHGISSDRITSQGFGASRPIAENSSPEGRATNRRVEIVVQQPSETHEGGPSTTTPREQPPSPR